MSLEGVWQGWMRVSRVGKKRIEDLRGESLQGSKELRLQVNAELGCSE